MKTIPDTEYALVLRTDFSDQSTWDRLCAEIRKPVGIFRFMAFVNYLDDAQYAEISKAQLLQLLPPNYNHSFIIVADKTTFTHSEHPLLIIDLFDDSKRDFRAVPKQIQAIENNLSIANMDFEDFADNVDQDGIFRGFPGDPYNS
jgi:uncharacterized protein YbcV (DUF1398 family)